MPRKKTLLAHNFIGCSGFSERLWKPFFYPEDLANKEFLNYYALHLNAVEINSTFYRKPTQKTLENWYAATPAEFAFFIKIPKAISHIAKLVDTSEAVSEFCTHISTGLKDKLAGFLFQLPPSFIYSTENLAKLLASVDSQFVNVVEFRHPSWWIEEVYQALREANIVMSGVSINKAPPKDISSAVIQTHPSIIYYRLHGVPVMFKSEYSEIELDKLADELQSKKAEKTYVFFNNTFGIAGIKNALYLTQRMQN